MQKSIKLLVPVLIFSLCTRASANVLDCLSALTLTEHQRSELQILTGHNAAGAGQFVKNVKDELAGRPRYRQVQEKSRYLELSLRHKDRRGRWVHRVRDVFPDWNEDTDILVAVSSSALHTHIFTDGIRLDTIGMGTFGVQFKRETEIVQQGLFIRLRDLTGESVKRLGTFIRAFRQEEFSINHITCMQQIYSIFLKYSGLSIPESPTVPPSSAMAIRLFLSANIHMDDGTPLLREVVYTDKNLDPLSLLARLHKREFEGMKERSQQLLSLATFLNAGGRDFYLDEVLSTFKIEINPALVKGAGVTREDGTVSPELLLTLSEKLEDLPMQWLVDALEWGE